MTNINEYSWAKYNLQVHVQAIQVIWKIMSANKKKPLFPYFDLITQALMEFNYIVLFKLYQANELQLFCRLFKSINGELQRRRFIFQQSDPQLT